jgi:hypothetical protein
MQNRQDVLPGRCPLLTTRLCPVNVVSAPGRTDSGDIRKMGKSTVVTRLPRIWEYGAEECMEPGRCGQEMIAGYQMRQARESERTTSTVFLLPTPLLTVY